MNSRIESLRDELLSCPDALCTERALLATEAYQANQGEPWTIQRARALEHILANMTIYVREDELLVGNLSSTLGARPLYPEYHMGVKSLHLTGDVGERVDLALYPELQEVYDFWKERDLFYHVERERPEETRLLQEQLIINTAAEIDGHGHITIDNEKILALGLEGLKRQAREGLKASAEDPERRIFYKSVIIAMNAVVQFSNRYAELCEELARGERRFWRKAELESLAAICRKVPAEPAETFQEALQAIWFLYLTLHQESNGYSVSPGRLDKILGDYYVRDVEAGRLDRERALELVENFDIKIMEIPIVDIKSMEFPIRGVLDTKTAGVTLGGVDAEGRYLCNEVTRLFLESIPNLRLNAPAIVVRWHKSAPADLKRQAIRVLRAGTGYPGLFGDKAAIAALVDEHGVEEADACDWSEVGCAELFVPGKMAPVSAGLINLPRALELAVNNGVDLATGRTVGAPTLSPDQFASMDEVLEQYEAQFTYLLKTLVGMDATVRRLHGELRPQPLASSYMTNCLTRGKDLLRGGEKYNLVCVGLFSLANLVDSLFAVDEITFRQKRCGLPAYLEALKTDFASNPELKARIDRLPRYGNNLEEVDRYVDLVSEIHWRARKSVYVDFGIDVAYEAIPRQVHETLGRVSPATFDGRIRGQSYADGISPGQGRDRAGLTSAALSVTRTRPGRHWTNGYTYNVKLHPCMLDDPGSFEKIVSLVDTYFELGGMQMQITCVRAEDLLEAQKEPEKYKNLIVRVAGFSAYFTTLRKELQDEIISRTHYDGAENVSPAAGKEPRP
ncbi:MAG: hypothetical protein NTW86_15175 [Candidatus Sumerlaeota bacterium]|nr:hypothetical protein [Candidatus Sumerlaeota bacterium]